MFLYYIYYLMLGFLYYYFYVGFGQHLMYPTHGKNVNSQVLKNPIKDQFILYFTQYYMCIET